MSNKLPKPLTLMKNAASALAKEVKAIACGDGSVDEQEIVRRLSLCHRCDLYIRAQKRCSQCGCYMQFKAKMRSQHCPVGKW